MVFILSYVITYSSAQSVSVETQLIHNTVKLNCSYLKEIDGETKIVDGSGTAFLFNFSIDSLRIPCFVTNKHVVKDAYFGSFYMTKKDSLGLPDYNGKYTVTPDNFDELWIDHPNPDVDLAIMFAAPIFREAEKKNVRLFTIGFGENNIPNENDLEKITAIEEVYMIGYPLGIWDKVNNIPIVRSGETATPIFLDYQGKSEFLINIPIFGGSSGSPIIIYDKLGYANNIGGIEVGRRRFYLVGVNYAGMKYNAEGTGKIIIDSKESSVSTTTSIFANLSIIVKSEEILGFKPIISEFLKK